MHQGILAHDLRQRESVFALPLKGYGPGGDIFSHFKYVIHAAAFPSLQVIAQFDIDRLCPHGVAGRHRANGKPEIIIGICIRVAEHDINIVAGAGICDNKSERGFVAVSPGLRRYGDRSFVDVYPGTGKQKRGEEYAMEYFQPGCLRQNYYL